MTGRWLPIREKPSSSVADPSSHASGQPKPRPFAGQSFFLKKLDRGCNPDMINARSRMECSENGFIFSYGWLIHGLFSVPAPPITQVSGGVF